MVETGSTAHVLASLVPPPVVRRLAGETGPPSQPGVEHLSGAVLFADISGFTPLAERLAALGARGAEELTAALNATFGAMIALIDEHGGEVLKFAGDALLAAWEDDDRGAATRRAAACGLALHGVATRAAAAVGAELTLRIGVGSGRLDVLYVSGSPRRWECVPTGSPLDQVTLAEHEAAVGETVLSPEAWAAVAAGCEGEARGSGCVRLLSVTEAPSPAPSRPLPTSAGAAALAPFVSTAVRDRVAAGQAEWLSELRRITVLFIRLHDPGGGRDALQRVQAAFRRIAAVLDEAQATVDKLAVDDKGMVALAALGLPPHSHLDGPVRGLQAARRLNEVLRAAGLGSDIGVATGRAFCGVVGSPLRREYTVIGDTVNLAARLMQQAEGDVLCDEATREAATGRVALSAPWAVRLKGKAEPVLVCRPLASNGPAVVDEEPGALEQIVGREAEQARLDAALEGLESGRHGVVLLEGRGGQGKGRLISAFVGRARARGVRCLRGSGDPVEQHTPFHAWRPVFSSLLGLGGLSPEARLARLRERSAADPELARLAPLLREVTDLDLEDSELTAAMEGEVRAFNLQDLLVHLLEVELGAHAPGGPPRPVAVILEDIQWLDSASRAMARRVAEGVSPVLLLLSSHPLAGAPAVSPAEPLPPDLRSIVERPDTQRILLAPLSRTDTARLLQRRLGAPPTEGLTEAVYERSAGNPDFILELALGLEEGGLLRREAGRVDLAHVARAREELALPETLQAAVLARIDRLEPRQQLMLKVASVIGRTFPYRLLEAVYPVRQDRPRLREECDALVALDLTREERPEPDPAWQYRQETTREVAYELLLYAQRRQLHRAVAEAIEGRGPDRLAPAWPRLAWHWDQAGDPARTLGYLELAGDQAVKSGAYQEAERAFRRCEELLAEHPELVPAEQIDRRRAHWERQRGEAFLGLGQLPESRAALERAVALLGFGLPRTRVGIVLRLVREAGRQLRVRTLGPGSGRPSEAERAVRREAALAYLRLIETYFFLAGPLETAHAALAALNIAEAAGPSPELARAYALTGWILSMAPQLTLANRYLALADAVVRTPAGRAALQPVRFFTGFTRTATGHWEEARASLGEAIEQARRLGDKRRWIEAVCGISSSLHFQGDYEERVQLGREVLYASARRQGDFQAEAWGILDQLESLLALGDLPRLSPLLDELEPFLAHDIGRSEQVWGRGMLAQGRLVQGRLEEAWRAAVATNRAAASMTPVAVYVFEGHAGAAEVLLALARDGWAGVPRAELLAELDRSCRELERYARVFPYARPRALCTRGRQRALLGRHGALRALEGAVAAAVRLRMPLEEGIARLSLAWATGRIEERTRAQDRFEELGAAWWGGEQVARWEPEAPTGSG